MSFFRLLKAGYPSCLALLLVAYIAGCAGGPSTIEKLKPSEPRPGIVFTSDRSGNWDLYLVQPDGSGLTQLTDHPKPDADPHFSPDGGQIVFRSRRDGSSDIFVMSADGSAPVNLINDPEDSFADEFAPRWNPDGKTFSIYTDRFPNREGCEEAQHQIAFLQYHEGDYEIDLFDTVAGEQYSSSWSPDGRFLVFNSSCGVLGFQFYLYDSETGETKKLTSTEPYSHSHPAWSHDGQSLAFSANFNGNPEIYILNLITNKRVQMTDHPAKDRMPSWAPDDSQIAFVSDRDGNDEIYIMNVNRSELVNISQHPAEDWYPSWSPVAETLD